MNPDSNPNANPQDQDQDHSAGSDPPLTTDDLAAAVDDPASDKQATGPAQAAENRAEDPPA
jgi:hypothetical protein